MVCAMIEDVIGCAVVMLLESHPSTEGAAPPREGVWEGHTARG